MWAVMNFYLGRYSIFNDEHELCLVSGITKEDVEYVTSRGPILKGGKVFFKRDDPSAEKFFNARTNQEIARTTGEGPVSRINVGFIVTDYVNGIKVFTGNRAEFEAATGLGYLWDRYLNYWDWAPK